MDMKSIRLRLQSNIERRKNKGTAMMVVIIIIGVLIVFCFSLLLVSYTLYASQTKKASSLRCSEAANTLSKALQVELTDPNAYRDSTLWNYLRFNLAQNDAWNYYDPYSAADSVHSETYAFRYFDVEVNQREQYLQKFGSELLPEGYPAKVQLCIYWEPPEGYEESDYLSPGTLTYHKMDKVELYIAVTCESGNQSYTVVNKYRLSTSLLQDEDVEMKEELQNNETKASCNPKEYATYHEEQKWEWDFVSRE